ncbi:PUB3, partial [Symbiodinium sp. CCMP2456]
PSADTFDLGGLAFHPAVATGRRLMPCATTPAPIDEGRPKPRATRGKTSKDTDARWSDGKRQYAPWHYQLEAMLQDSQGVLHLPTAEIKEQLHGIPTGYTAQADDRTRHRMIGEGWHWGVAGRILGFVVLAAWAAPLAEARLGGPSVGLRPPTPAVPTHWASAPLMQHSLARRPALEPALSTVIDLRRRCRHDTTSDRPRPFQGPTFLGLLRDLGYPATADLEEDLRLGFDMLGPVRRAPGWKPRADGRYSNPSGLDRLRQENPTYVGAKCSRARAGVHTAALLEELVQEARLGRVTGPCAPLGDCFAALSFAICQVDENGDLNLRRGEDWRRSGHNATMSAEDVPTHHFLTDIVDFILAAWCEGWGPKVFGHDLQKNTSSR